MRHLAKILPVLALGLAVGCGGSGGTSPATSGTGTLRVTMSDSAVDHADEVWIAIDHLEIAKIVDGETSWSLLETVDDEYDLLKLQNDVSVVLSDGTLQAGDYAGLRVVLSGGGSPVKPGSPTPNRIVIGEDEFPLHVPSGEQTGLKMMDGFSIRANEITELRIDFNVRTSVVKRGSKDDYLLKPRLELVPVVVSGSISGTVASSSDSDPLPTTTISAQVDGFERLSTQAAEDGTYKLVPLRAGTYDLVASAAGFTPALKEGIEVLALHDTGDQNFTLEPSDTGSISGTAPAGDAYVIVLRWKGYFLAQTGPDASDGTWSFEDVAVGSDWSLELLEDGVVVDTIDSVSVSAGSDTADQVLSAGS